MSDFDPGDLHRLLDVILQDTVERIVGEPDVKPRPGQVTLAHDILGRMLEGDGRLAGSAPTGLGKSAATLAPMLLVAATLKQRSVLSTESKALQAQYATKDYPVVADAVQAATGIRPTLAIHKGFRNHACLSRALGAVASVAGRPEVTLADALRVLNSVNGPGATPNPFSAGTVTIDGRDIDRDRIAALARWVLFDEGGDRSLYEPGCSDDEWMAVSCDAGDCIGGNPEDPDCSECPFYAECPAQGARSAVAAADVVVTNHTLLGMQAALSIPVVLSNRRLGRFHHLVLDEAHALPDEVRKAGGGEINAGQVRGLSVLPRRFLTGEPTVEAVADEGRRLADQLEQLLFDFIPAASRENGERPYAPDQHPLEPILVPLTAWLTKVRDLLPSEDSTSHAPTRVRIRQANGRIDRFSSELVSSFNSELPHVRSVSTFIRRGAPTAALKFSPVYVAPLIEASLCSVDLPENKQQRKARLAMGEPAPREAISVSAVSGTLPTSFPVESGLDVPVRDYPSPFDDAYGGSLFHAPRLLTDADLQQVCERKGTRWVLNPALHAAWCAGKIVEAVATNRGSALILAATVANGKRYVEALRAARPEWKVLSQWDGRDTRAAVQEWRNDPTSVLVGTRSLMTGVDGQGDTCTLVIIDRPPRAAKNLVDDARADAIRREKRLSEWDADRLVYVTDAALLLEQASGRLIRGVNDSGMVICLDPRFTKSPIAYNDATRKEYLHAVRRFSLRTTDWGEAMGWLGQHAAARIIRAA